MNQRDEAGTSKESAGSRTAEASTEELSLGAHFLGIMLGHAGLAKSFWLYGLLGGNLFCWMAYVALGASAILGAVVAVLAAVYVITVAVGVWNAAGKPAVDWGWAAFARLFAVLWILGAVALVVVAVSNA
ncbi:hypothetical protein [Piscinibacterium candidicorallinum]|uniref:Uncharacterized protein n=1 Tax=Piscinibacterium candidicorallinum TaxID=1793872 RepID=A0ABV7H7E9_9BURK